MTPDDGNYYIQEISVLENPPSYRTESRSFFEEELSKSNNPNIRYFDMLSSDNNNHHSFHPPLFEANTTGVIKKNLSGNTTNDTNWVAKVFPQQGKDNINEVFGKNDATTKKTQSSGRNPHGTKQPGSTSKPKENYNEFPIKSAYQNLATATKNGKPPLVAHFSVGNAMKEASMNVNLNLSAFQKKTNHSRTNSEVPDNNHQKQLSRKHERFQIQPQRLIEKMNTISEQKESIMSSIFIKPPLNQNNIDRTEKNENLKLKIVESKKKNPASSIGPSNTPQRISDKLRSVSPSYANYKIENFENVMKRLNNKTLSAERIKKPFH